MSQVVAIELPDELTGVLRNDSADLAAEFRLAAAIKWYEVGRLSQGKAAEVAGLSRADFIDELARFGVSPFQETSQEIFDTLRNPAK